MMGPMSRLIGLGEPASSLNAAERDMEELAIDEELTLVERVLRYATKGTFLQKVVFVRELPNCIAEIGLEAAMRQVLPLFPLIASDNEATVRQTFAQQLPRITQLLARAAWTTAPLDADGGGGGGGVGGCGAGRAVPRSGSLGGETGLRQWRPPEELSELEERAYRSVIDVILPTIRALIVGDGLGDGCAPTAGTAAQKQQQRAFLLSPQVTDFACAALLELASCLREPDVGAHVLTLVLCLAHDDELEERRVVAASLLGELAPVLALELTTQFVLPEIVSLADDSVFRVRKAAALKLGNVCAVVGEAALPRGLHAFRKLCVDDIWGVRKAAAEALPLLARMVPLAARESQLVPILSALQDDPSHWVRNAAQQSLGPLLATLPKDALSAQLVERFCALALASAGGGGIADGELVFHCAFNLPAVLAAIGASRWAELADAHAALAAHGQWKVRRTLAYSLHELGALIKEESGERAVDAALLIAFDLFLKDLDEVRVGALTHLAQMLAAVSDAARRQYLGALVEIQTDTDNWRARAILAQQLAALGELYEAVRSRGSRARAAARAARTRVAQRRRLGVAPAVTLSP
jgi:hypothetical protein